MKAIRVSEYGGPSVLKPEVVPTPLPELPLAQAARSHEAVMEPGHHGKIVLVP